MRDLIVLGASVRAAAFSAIRAGFAPYAIDLFADRDLAAACPAVKISQYPGEFLSALGEAPQSPWLYCGGLENHPRLVDQLAAVRPLLGNRGAVLRRVREASRLGDAAREAGLPFPARPDGSAKDGVWLVKPRRSSGGLGVRFASASELRRSRRGMYLQRYVPGEAASVVFVAAGGRVRLVGTTRQLLGRDFGMPREFLYVGSIGPLGLSEVEAERLRGFGDVLAERFGLVGLFNVDLVRNDDGLWPVEVNPRYSASMEVIERTNGVDLIGMHVEACELGRLPAESSSAAVFCAGKAVVYARRDGVVPAALDEIIGEWNVAGRWPGVADLPRVGDRVCAGQPVVTVFAEAGDAGAVEAELRRRVAIIESLLADS